MESESDLSNSESSDNESDCESESSIDSEDNYLYSFNPNFSAAEVQKLMEEEEEGSTEEENCFGSEMKWVKDGCFTPLNLDNSALETTFNIPSLSANSTPFEVFSHFVLRQELEKVCVESARYVEQCKEEAREKGTSIPFTNFVFFNTTELYRFIALRIATGLIKKPSLKDYWSTKPLHGSSFFHDTMSRNRFEEIKRSLHFADNKTSDFKANRMLKLGSLPNFLTQKFSESIIPGRNLCIDESLAKFKGRLSFRQYIPNKRARFGVKLYVLADCMSKFVINIIPYQGETTNFVHDDRKADLGYGGAIVRSLMDPYLNTSRTVFIDNFFNSPVLAHELYQANTGVVGTVRAHRKYMPKFSTRLKKGEVEAFTTGTVLVERWMDRREVVMLNTCIDHSMQPNKKDKMKPNFVLSYNKCMCAVDELDKSLQPYFAERKCLKWYQKIWLRYIYIAALNSLRVINALQSEKKIAFNDFLEELLQEMIDCNPIEKSTRGRPSAQPSAEARLSGHDHFPNKIRKMNSVTHKMKADYLRCVFCTANNTRHKTAYECSKCNVRLCVGIDGRPCFEQYHSIRKIPTKKRSYSIIN